VRQLAVGIAKKYVEEITPKGEEAPEQQ